MIEDSVGAAMPMAGGAAKLRQSAEAFTAVALNEMLAPIFSTAAADGPFDGGAGERAFRPMLVSEIAKHMAHAGGFGLTDAVYRQMLTLQEGGR